MKFVSVEGETAVVQLNCGRRIFRTSFVKTWDASILNEFTEEGKIVMDDKYDDVLRTEEEDQKKEEPNEESLTLRESAIGKVTVRKGSKEERELSE